MTTRSVYTVRGMSCGHCATLVSEELGALGGVLKVEVDVATGRVMVTSADPLPADRIGAAVGRLGYELVR
ncbi:heavy-metal-associated domain-containing protein [Gandjariella thermophila]|uniref:Metal-binding protein n=1 Tax=Gandjariella thermophila TaxID=1931992 RepID=A0A4D4JFG9_9PSEU|nr:heavy-metal-associated domain-containing protein [Gandjariella thermophila]GDY32647.1 metal-binding protein [Gandjariella thermophila]